VSNIDNLGGKRGPPRFVKGQSGNPGGRAKGLERIFRDELNAVREKVMKADAEGQPIEHIFEGYKALFHRLWGIVWNGEDKDALTAIKILLERTHGAPKQKIVIDDKDDDDEDNVDDLSLDELRILARVRARATVPDDVH
jgi:hypothetical protein